MARMAAIIQTVLPYLSSDENKVQLRAPILMMHNVLIYFVNRPRVINHKIKLCFRAHIKSLVSVTCNESSRIKSHSWPITAS